MNQELLTTSQTLTRAKERGVGCSRYTLDRWINEKAFPVVRSGNRVYIYWPHFWDYVTGGPVNAT